MSVFQQVSSIFRAQLHQPPVIQDQPVSTSTLASLVRSFEYWPSPLAIVSSRNSGMAHIMCGVVPLPADLVCQGAGQPGFANAGGAGNEHVSVLFYPLVTV